jgi:hypothetical protein
MNGTSNNEESLLRAEGPFRIRESAAEDVSFQNCFTTTIIYGEARVYGECFEPDKQQATQS